MKWYKTRKKPVIVEYREVEPIKPDENNVEWIRALTAFEFLIPEAPHIYRLNPFRIPQLFQLLKEKPQTKLQ